MLEAHKYDLATEVSQLLMLARAQETTLDWSVRPTQLAEEKLNELEDPALLGVQDVVDEGAASLVRAMLYLWNGWPSEAAIIADTAQDPERAYVLGFCERQHGNPERAKQHLQSVGDHVIHGRLTEDALNVLATAPDPQLQRFHQLLQLGQAWEAFMFIDLVELGRAGKLSQEGRLAVCRLQCLEFELLLLACYEAATGSPVQQQSEKDDAVEREERLRRLRRMRERPPQRRQQGAPPGTSAGGAEATAPEPKTVKVGCPKCQHVVSLPESSRGEKTSCPKCGTTFTVPTKGPKLAKPTPSGGAGGVAVKCPRCGDMVRHQEADRGKRAKCRGCGVVYTVPKKQTAKV